MPAVVSEYLQRCSVTHLRSTSERRATPQVSFKAKAHIRAPRELCCEQQGAAPVQEAQLRKSFTAMKFIKTTIITTLVISHASALIITALSHNFALSSI